jgi:hypothetical protein
MVSYHNVDCQLRLAFILSLVRTMSLAESRADDSETSGEVVVLAPYLAGGYACINDGVTPHGVVKSVLDDGGPIALLKNGTDRGNQTSNQQLVALVTFVAQNADCILLLIASSSLVLVRI